MQINRFDMFTEVPVAVKHTKNDILNTNVKYGVWYDILTEYTDIDTDKTKGYTPSDILSFCNTKGYTPSDILSFCNKFKIRCFGYNFKMERFITNKDINIVFNPNLPAFVYYFNDEHIYLINDKQMRHTLLNHSRDGLAAVGPPLNRPVA